MMHSDGNDLSIFSSILFVMLHIEVGKCKCKHPVGCKKNWSDDLPILLISPRSLVEGKTMQDGTQTESLSVYSIGYLQAVWP